MKSRVYAASAVSTSLKTTVPQMVRTILTLKPKDNLEWIKVEGIPHFSIGIEKTEKPAKDNDNVCSTYLVSSSASTLRTTVPESVTKELELEAGNELTWFIYSSDGFVIGVGTPSKISL